MFEIRIVAVDSAFHRKILFFTFLLRELVLCSLAKTLLLSLPVKLNLPQVFARQCLTLMNSLIHVVCGIIAISN